MSPSRQILVLMVIASAVLCAERAPAAPWPEVRAEAVEMLAAAPEREARPPLTTRLQDAPEPAADGAARPARRVLPTPDAHRLPPPLA